MSSSPYGPDPRKHLARNPIACDEVPVVAESADLPLNEQCPNSLRGVIQEAFSISGAIIALCRGGKFCKCRLDFAALATKCIGSLRGKFVFQRAGCGIRPIRERSWWSEAHEVPFHIAMGKLCRQLATVLISS
ncbi:hypothetical protein EV128_11184 [Rhizobium azibense]|nr:hypothetical protein EV128_11184 [Rhizobium azibense]